MKPHNPTSLLEYFHGLATAPQRPEDDEVLREVCRLVNANAIGVNDRTDATASLAFADSDDALTKFPWQGNSDLLKQIERSLTAEVFAEARGVWLVTAVSAGQLVWAYRTGKSGWSETERTQWAAVSLGLDRWLSQLPGSPGAIRALQRQLEKAATVTARLTHDFGNYLTGILGFTELSLSQTTPETAQHRFLQEVLQSAQQGAAWIHRLQLFCRRNPAPAWPTRLASVLAQEESRLRSAETSSLRWEFHVPSDLPLLDIDAGALQTILQELVNNAREATKNRGTITIAARAVQLTAADCRPMIGAAQPGQYVELTIRDDGPGIAPEDRANLFNEVYFSTKPRRRGVGLLAVYGILQSARGSMALESAGVGKGVCVRILLPAAAIAEPTFETGAKPPSILLAHGKPLLFDSLRILLEARGCRVTVVDSPQAALAAYCAPKASFALLIVDVNMPQMGGFDLARRILDHDSSANFLFLCTQPSFHGLSDDELPKRFEMLRWPLQPAPLLRAVQTALTRVQS